jgi:multidrug resistance efflux pump
VNVLDTQSRGASPRATRPLKAYLPQVGRDLNRVGVAQRFFVWVRLDSPPPEAMFVGMSASVNVYHGHFR